MILRAMFAGKAGVLGMLAAFWLGMAAGTIDDELGCSNSGGKGAGPTRTMSDWFRVARRRDVVHRALRVAALVGTILVAINQGNVLLAGDLSGEVIAKILLTYCVPYGVSTYASVAALLAQDQRTGR